MQSALESTAVASKNELLTAPMRADNTKVEHECLTAGELASWLRVNRKTVYEYAARNVIPCRRLGRRLLFHRPAVVAWLARSSTVGPTAQRVAIPR
jgi:excisionase family DNA binding protein